MFRAVLWTLRQRRYAALAAAGLVVALICIGAGTFEMHRFESKRHDNGVLRSNAHAPVAPLSSSLVPLTGQGAAPSSFAVRYRPVTASGVYLAAHEEYVAEQTQGGRQGFWVLTPLRTSSGTLLVVRGFVAATSTGVRPDGVAPPPSGAVHVTGWLDTASNARDQLGRLGHEEITAINPSEQAARLGAPTYQAYLTLNAHQPGTSGLQAVALPDLSNPTGGAEQWQLFSYIIQWYVFAALALVLPFIVSRSEVRDARRRFLGAGPVEIDADETPALAGVTDGGAQLTLRGAGELTRRAETPEQRWERAVRLADRYGRSLGDLSPTEGVAAVGAEAAREVVRPVVRSSRHAPHGSDDVYHGSYNDYLWQLALADGGLDDAGRRPPAADEPQGGRPSGEHAGRPVLRPDGSVDDEAAGDGPRPLP